jgi:FkbM family methyltransferase
VHTAAAIFLQRNRVDNNTVIGDVHTKVMTHSTAWEATLQAGQQGAPHAANTECSYHWTLPLSDISVRHNLIPGATVIFEVGGNIGEDLAQYVWRFPQAKIYSYEPVPELYQTLQQKFGANPNVKITQVGVSNADRQTSFVVGGNHGEGSSHANASQYGQTISVQLRDANALLAEVRTATGKVPDVVSINCEGCEYGVLSRMAQTGWLGAVPFLQLSWHVPSGIPDRVPQRCAIEKVLLAKYNPAYHALYGWQGWSLKTAPSFLQEDSNTDDDAEEQDKEEEGEDGMSADSTDEGAEDSEQEQDDSDDESQDVSSDDAGEDDSEAETDDQDNDASEDDSEASEDAGADAETSEDTSEAASEDKDDSEMINEEEPSS